MAARNKRPVELKRQKHRDGVDIICISVIVAKWKIEQKLFNAKNHFNAFNYT
jgi:hypothetical protein